jgi:hypothetical protein
MENLKEAERTSQSLSPSAERGAAESRSEKAWGWGPKPLIEAASEH